MFRRLFVLMTFSLLSATAAGAQVHGQLPPVEYELTGESVEIPMKIDDTRIILDVLINGKGPFPFIFDTGAQGSVIDLTFAKELGLELGEGARVASPNGAGMAGHQVTIENLSIGGLTLKNMPSFAFEGMPFKKTGTQPRGVIGPFGLSGLLVTLDYPGGMLGFRRGSLPEADNLEVFGWDEEQPLPEIPVSFDGVEVLAILDSGSSGSLGLPVDYAGRLKLQGPLLDRSYVRSVDHVRPVRGARMEGTFRIGRYTMEAPMVSFVDIAKTTGNVGSLVLRQFTMTIDPANRRLRLSGPADGKLEPVDDGKPRYGIQLAELEASPIVVDVVDAASPAEKAGLRAGDRIITMNGRPVEELGVIERLDAIKASPLQIGIKRGEETVDLTMTLK
jgi:hypothetical protein